VPALSPIGWTRSVEGGIVTLVNPAPPLRPSSTVPDVTAAIGDASAVTREPVIIASTVKDQRMHIEFKCERNSTDRVDELKYMKTSAGVVVDATVSSLSADDPPCNGDVGASIDIDVREFDLPDSTPISGGSVSR
jgi:hypothetical protein